MKSSPPPPPEASFAFHSHSTKEVLAHLKVSEDQGLSESQAQERVAQYGLNELAQEKQKGLVELIVEQFDDFLVKILIVSALISFLLALIEDFKHEGFAAFIEPLVIISILVMNAAMGVYQELNAQSAMDKLKQMQSEHAKCTRDGNFLPELPGKDLVPGDIIDINVGDRVPADCRVLRLKSTTLRTNESCLTGEPEEVEKSEGPVEADMSLAQRSSMLYSGTTVCSGNARCVVTTTGMKTEIGKIQGGIMRAAAEEQKTPLTQKLDEFGELLAKIIGCICVLVWVINIPNFKDPMHGGMVRGAIYYLKIAVSLGVAAIPEGLPAVITLCLSLGSARMAKKNCIVRCLPSVETLGCTTVICSDKTGTLTTNQMVVAKLCHFGANSAVLSEHSVAGNNYAPEGKVDDLESLPQRRGKTVLNWISKVSCLCNDTNVEWEATKKAFVCAGSPTEAALKVFSEKLGLSDRELPPNAAQRCNAASNHWTSQYKKLGTLEFTRDRKRMSVLCQSNESGAEMLGKGASEMVLASCTQVMLESGEVMPLTIAMRSVIERKITQLAGEALRTIALFSKCDGLGELPQMLQNSSHPRHSELRPENFKNFEHDLTFLGLVGIRDPPRMEVKSSIALCHQAGIRVIMITGDNETTAMAIARDIGIFGRDEDVSQKAFNGPRFMELSDDEKLSLLRGPGGRVFSRTEPLHKQELVRLLKSLNHVVAMTGDGVNDAPALKNADIGIAMGISGTEVAKEAAAMILADDNFTSIVSAVEEGRSIYQNTKAFIRYLISSNIGEVVSILTTTLLGLPEGLIPVQLLWVNLVTDGPPATALGFNPSDPDAMMKKPRSKDESLISPWVLTRFMVTGIYVGLSTVGIFIWWFTKYPGADGHSLVSLADLRNWSECPHWIADKAAEHPFHPNSFRGIDLSQNPCHYFKEGKVVASTLSLSVLVVVEMCIAVSAVSEEHSMLSMPPFLNPQLCLAVVGSVLVHLAVLYIPVLNVIFQVVPLTLDEWKLVLAFSLPVLLVEEVMKYLTRMLRL